METLPVAHRMIEGSVRLRRVGGFGFPIEELVDENGTVLAHLGRNSSIRIFFGKGRRVRLDDGTEWRIKATTSGPHIVPIVRTEEGTIAVSAPLPAKRSYGINGRDYGFTLIPLGHLGLRRAGLWSLRRHETQVATVEDHDRIIHTTEPIPLAAGLLAFTLMSHGIPGEASLMPKRD